VTFSFWLKFQLAERPYAARYAQRLALWEADGVRVLADRRGRMRLEVCRAGTAALAAMRRTVSEARRIFPSCALVEAGPDHVGLREVAGIYRISRQAMRLRMLTDAHLFPAPLLELKAGTWRLVELLEWIGSGGGSFFDRRELEVARAAATVNLAIQTRRLREVRLRTWPLIDLPKSLNRLA